MYFKKLEIFGFKSFADKMVLKLTETFFNKNNQPLVFGISYFDQTVLHLRLVQAWG